MDIGTASRPGHHLRMAIVTSEILLHQAEVDVKRNQSAINGEVGDFVKGIPSASFQA